MTTMTKRAFLGLMMVGMLCPGLAEAKGNRTRLRTRLSRTADAPRLASAKAKFEERRDRRKFNVEGEDMASLNGQSVSVYVDGAFVGSARVVAGGFSVDLDSRLGHSIPSVAEESSVEVRVGATTIFTGEF